MAQHEQTNEQNCTPEIGCIRWYGSGEAPTTRRAMAFVIAVAVLAAAVAGCTNKATRPLHPGADEGPVSTLVLDNQVPDSLWSTRLGLYLEVAIDGFSPTDRLNLPMGQTTLRLPVGSHEMTIKAELIGKASSMYQFKQTRIIFDTESKLYTIEFRMINMGIMKPGYGIHYSGWSTEQSAAWPSEVYIANPLF